MVWHYLRDPTFICFDTILECDRHTHTHTTTAYTTLSIASHGKKSVHMINIQTITVGISRQITSGEISNHFDTSRSRSHHQ